MSYCIECGLDAVVCFCTLEKTPVEQYVDAQRRCGDLRCYCRRHLPEGER